MKLNAQDKIFVVTTTSIFKDMIEQLGKNHVLVHSIVPTGSDPHLYEAKPDDVQICKNADLIMINGLHLEVWIEKLIKNSAAKAPVFLLTNHIKPVKTGKYPDPHAWMSASNGIIYAKNIAKAIITINPDLKQVIHSNLEKYIDSLQKLNTYIETEIQKIPESQKILITNHDAFRYYGQCYNLKLIPLMGVSTEGEPRTSDIIKIIEVIRQNRVPAIFVETSINPQQMTQIAADMHISIGGSLFSDSLGESNSSAGTYLGMLKTNTDMIVRALYVNTSNQNTKVKIQAFNEIIFISLFLIFLLITTWVFTIKLVNK
ncbi:MAG: zinc ABC transporter substrate-binding protein [Saprospiraceae bacterium]|nr:zinc ABC transporter substrate-binding protein [Saprospiraceae bacterium]MBK7523977.1 zinc ABC transporter substrate-binding protein [Saprospiraceae bacterium]MBK8079055.1 zinc ABC transporter substrate-binding protein [Saprospiraceae bacterium]MBK8372029.1 zinc ABC transporter substrate-binding protein [Saprospiraceae bacterium]MBK8818511.1 zinc ABC transporter substrate-binding protein [Saprospiraceae bacterium]